MSKLNRGKLLKTLVSNGNRLCSFCGSGEFIVDYRRWERVRFPDPSSGEIGYETVSIGDREDENTMCGVCHSDFMDDIEAEANDVESLFEGFKSTGDIDKDQVNLEEKVDMGDYRPDRIRLYLTCLDKGDTNE